MESLGAALVPQALISNKKKVLLQVLLVCALEPPGAFWMPSVEQLQMLASFSEKLLNHPAVGRWVDSTHVTSISLQKFQMLTRM